MATQPHTMLHPRRSRAGRPGPRHALLAVASLALGCGDLSPQLVVGAVRADAGSTVVPTATRDAGVDDVGSRPRDSGVEPTPPTRADLLVVRAEGRPDHLGFGETFELVAVIENLGRMVSPSTLVKAFLVPTGPLAGGNDEEVGAVDVPMLSTGEGKDVVIEGKVPLNIRPGRYELVLWVDPDDRVDEAREDNNQLFGGTVDVGDLRVTPAVVDFGVVAPGCSTETDVVIEHLGPNRAFVTEARLEAGPTFALRPVSLPLGIDGGDAARLTLRFAPLLTGPAIGRLTLRSDVFFGDRALLVVGEGRFNPLRQDLGQQRAGPQLDVVVVVQDGCVTPGCPLRDEQQALVAAFGLFQQATAAIRADVRVLVTTTDPSPGRLGRLRGPPLDRAGLGRPGALAAQVVAGADGSTLPSGLAAAHAVVESGVLRPNAGVIVLIVALDDDRSGDTPEQWVQRMRASLGDTGPERLRISGLIGPPPAGCEDAEVGVRYARAIALTGGVVSSICDIDDFVVLFRFGDPELGLLRRFPLSRRPITPETIEVELDDRLAPRFDQVDGSRRWSYAPEDNSVLFDLGHVPAPGTRVTIRYRSRC